MFLILVTMMICLCGAGMKMDNMQLECSFCTPGDRQVSRRRHLPHTDRFFTTFQTFFRFFVLTLNILLIIIVKKNAADSR